MVTELVATLHTAAGDLRLRLVPNHETEANVVGLAGWLGPVARQRTTRPRYDNTVFHRVTEEFMIQGGEPTPHRNRTHTMFGEVADAAFCDVADFAPPFRQRPPIDRRRTS